MEGLQNYLLDYKSTFESYHNGMTIENHESHNADPEYWDILLQDIKLNPEFWSGKKALDFGCGCGRNLYNLSTLADWSDIDGCDISPSNVNYSKQWFDNKNQGNANCKTWETNGKDIYPAPDNYYDFIMSHIVFQHISNYSVRYSIITDLYRSLKPGGICSLHFMDMSVSAPYYENNLSFQNCRVGNPDYLVDDFQKIGFKNVSVQTGGDYISQMKSYYIKGTK